MGRDGTEYVAVIEFLAERAGVKRAKRTAAKSSEKTPASEDEVVVLQFRIWLNVNGGAKSGYAAA